MPIVLSDTMTYPDNLCHHLPINRLVNVLDSIHYINDRNDVVILESDFPSPHLLGSLRRRI
jgi:hypothetical protein